ncbi:hypothetical protein PVL29_023238 [Vitis rotundifolia]|uniref:Uncharacterized protein n=1 Tax=Vitis rotundifolia TaxID=103349 RepID=A0AA38YN53_VITRO|nr:hypothetical protein PVL29_023238 [Vitis rotundifolia]
MGEEGSGGGGGKVVVVVREFNPEKDCMRVRKWKGGVRLDPVGSSPSSRLVGQPNL